MSTSIQSRQRRKTKQKNCWLLKKIKQSEELQQIASVMSNPEATEEVGNAGMMFVILYGGRKEDTLGGLRFAKFMAMVSSSSSSQRTLIRA